MKANHANIRGCLNNWRHRQFEALRLVNTDINETVLSQEFKGITSSTFIKPGSIAELNRQTMSNINQKAKIKMQNDKAKVKNLAF